MFERPKQGEYALLIQVSVDQNGLASADCDEFISLAESAGAVVFDSMALTVKRPSPKLLIGQGKAEDLANIVAANDVELVLFNATLTPSQERNLERILKCRVLDRTGLILDIFAQRAHSHEGKLQVELAQLKHLSTRLVRGWTHLERQKGGIGLRGPGETQLETDRRLLAERIKQITKRLKKVLSQKELVRQYRKKRGFPVVAIVGYTNAGKSTLFNQLTDASVYAKDQLFATLDTTLRRLQHKEKETVLLTDTVGFVSNLPHELIAAFKSTLQETVDADLLLHVVDASDPEHWTRIDEVNQVLKEIKADKIPTFRVYNKIDLLEAEPQTYFQGKHIVGEKQGHDLGAFFVSSVSRQGIPELKTQLLQYFYGEDKALLLVLPNHAGKLRAALYNAQVVKSEAYDKLGQMLLEVVMKKDVYETMKTEFHDVWFEKKRD